MISISTTTFDLNGSLEIHNHAEPVLSDVVARVSRTKTLDLDVSITDGGCTDKDRDFVVEIEHWTAEQETFFEYIWDHYKEVVGTCRNGAYLLVRQSLSVTSKRLKATFYIKEVLSE